jgi:CheY-like chemotaxis protein
MKYEAFFVSTYIFSSLVSLLGFFLFIWWWAKKKRATSVYSYVTLLFGALAFDKGFEGLLYYSTMFTEGPKHNIANSPIWPISTLIVGLTITTIVFNVSKRILKQRRRAKMFQVRKYSKPDTFYRQEVLVVDDQIEVLDLVSMGISRRFPNIVTYKARTAEEAMYVFANHKHISLVITDMLLPKMTGFELCALIKEECPWTIVIGMTGYTSIYEFWTAREIGFDDYIQKPFHLDDLLDIIRKHLEVLERWKTIRVGRIKPKDLKRRKDDEREIVGAAHPRSVRDVDSGES